MVSGLKAVWFKYQKPKNNYTLVHISLRLFFTVDYTWEIAGWKWAFWPQLKFVQIETATDVLFPTKVIRSWMLLSLSIVALSLGFHVHFFSFKEYNFCNALSLCKMRAGHGQRILQQRQARRRPPLADCDGVLGAKYAWTSRSGCWLCRDQV